MASLVGDPINGYTVIPQNISKEEEEKRTVYLHYVNLIKDLLAQGSYTLSQIEETVNSAKALFALGLKIKLESISDNLYVRLIETNSNTIQASTNLTNEGYTIVVEVESDAEIANRLAQRDLYRSKENRKTYIYLYFASLVKEMLDQGKTVGEIETSLNQADILTEMDYHIKVDIIDQNIFVRLVDNSGARESYDIKLTTSINSPCLIQVYTKPDTNIRRTLQKYGYTDTVVSFDKVYEVLRDKEQLPLKTIKAFFATETDLKIGVGGSYFIRDLDIIGGYGVEVLPNIGILSFPKPETELDPNEDITITVPGTSVTCNIHDGYADIVSSTGDKATVRVKGNQQVNISPSGNTTVITVSRVLIIEPKVQEVDPSVFVPHTPEPAPEPDNGLPEVKVNYAFLLTLDGRYLRKDSKDIITGEKYIRTVDSAGKETIKLVSVIEKDADKFHVSFSIPIAIHETYEGIMGIYGKFKQKTQSELLNFIKEHSKIEDTSIIETAQFIVSRFNLTDYPSNTNSLDLNYALTKQIYIASGKVDYETYIKPLESFLNACRWRTILSTSLKNTSLLYLDQTIKLIENKSVSKSFTWTEKDGTEQTVTTNGVWTVELIEDAARLTRSHKQNPFTQALYASTLAALKSFGWTETEAATALQKGTYVIRDPNKLSERLNTENYTNIAKADAMIIMNPHIDDICITVQTYLDLMTAKEKNIPVIVWRPYDHSRFKDSIDNANVLVANSSYYNLFRQISLLPNRTI